MLKKDEFGMEEILLSKNNFEDYIYGYKGQDVVLYGCGAYYEYYINALKENGIEPIAIFDRDLSKNVAGYTILKFEECVSRFKNFDLIISAPTFNDEIIKYISKFMTKDRIYTFVPWCSLKHVEIFKNYLQVNENNFNAIYQKVADNNSRNVLKSLLLAKVSFDSTYLSNIISQTQYFDPEIFSFSDDEVFIDGGAHVGDTALEFAGCTNLKFSKIYSFEPDTDCFTELQKTKENNKIPNMETFKLGLYDCKTILNFNNSNSINGCGHACLEDSNCKIETVSLDEFIDERVSFIKLDIEGSELKALKGAKEIIKKYKPKLAICVYHKNEDLVDIFNYLESLDVGYKFYLRQYCGFTSETVLYANI